MRQTLDQAELYGTRATAMAGSLRKLPFPNGCDNLIFSGDYSEKMDIKEIMRVLNPHGLTIMDDRLNVSGNAKANEPGGSGYKRWQFDLLASF